MIAATKVDLSELRQNIQDLKLSVLVHELKGTKSRIDSERIWKIASLFERAFPYRISAGATADTLMGENLALRISDEVGEMLNVIGLEIFAD